MCKLAALVEEHVLHVPQQKNISTAAHQPLTVVLFCCCPPCTADVFAGTLYGARWWSLQSVSGSSLFMVVATNCMLHDLLCCIAHTASVATTSSPTTTHNARHTTMPSYATALCWPARQWQFHSHLLGFVQPQSAHTHTA